MSLALVNTAPFNVTLEYNIIVKIDQTAEHPVHAYAKGITKRSVLSDATGTYRVPKNTLHSPVSEQMQYNFRLYLMSKGNRILRTRKQLYA